MVTMEKRLRKELLNLLQDPPSNIKIDYGQIEKNLKEYVLNFQINFKIN